MGGLRFKSRAGQIEHSIVNGSPPLQHLFERSCVARARYTLHCNTVRTNNERFVKLNAIDERFGFDLAMF